LIALSPSSLGFPEFAEGQAESAAGRNVELTAVTSHIHPQNERRRARCGRLDDHVLAPEALALEPPRKAFGDGLGLRSPGEM
jgi:hypothetical protein